VAAAIGVVVSLATVALIEGIALVQLIGYGDGSEERFASIAASQPWWKLLLVPMVGGLIVGLLIQTLPGKRYHGIADVMEACAFNSGRMGVRSGVSAAIAAAVSLGVGAPLGREGPAVHIGASVSAWIAERLGLHRSQTLTLLGCGAAAAVTTSFNAPIAGVIFALEVVVGYYTLRVFAPVVIASLTAVVVHAYFYGSKPLFELSSIGSHNALELPLFALLGVLGGVTVSCFIYLMVGLRKTWDKTHLPHWIRPAVAGLIIGLVAIKYPMILSIGFEPTKAALEEALLFDELFLLLILKIGGTALALSSGFAGGVFSPSVFMGAMLGGVFILAFPAIPFVQADQALYSIAGMAAVSSAMLGAPISTILIVFEITRDYGVTLAVMTAAAFASTTMQMGKHTSFFRWQLYTRNVNIASGRNLSILRLETLEKLITQVFVRVKVGDSLRKVESQLGVSRKRIAVIENDEGEFIGSVELKEVISVSTEMTKREQDALRNDIDDSDQLQSSESDTEADETDGVSEPVIETIEQMVREHPVYANASTNLVVALQLMAENDLDHLAVVGEDDQGTKKILGIVYKADVLAEHYNLLRRAREEEFGVN